MVAAAGSAAAAGAGAAVAAAERGVASEVVLESLNHCSACVAVAAAADELKWEWLLAAVTFAVVAAAAACCMIVDLEGASFETRVGLMEGPLTGSFAPCRRACEAGLAWAFH